MTTWDGILLAVAVFIAVSSLIRLMIARRNTGLTELRQAKVAEPPPSAEKD